MLTARLLALLALVVPAIPVQPLLAQPAAVAPDMAGSTAAVRPVVALADGWRFRYGAQTGAERPGFDDGDWARVQVPHSWNRVGYYLTAAGPAANRPDRIDKTQGIGWYRLRFDADAALRGKRAWLEFDAASRIATVWLNGQLIGEHKGGYSRFRLDATKALRFDQPNLLAVRVDNSKPVAGSSTADVLPLTGDFFVPGGLYRPVRLIGTGMVHVDMQDHGGSGVRAVTSAVDGTRATVDVTTRLRNDGGTRRVRVETLLLDAEGRVAARHEQSVRSVAGDSLASAKLRLSAAHLWQGVDDPYLYRLSVHVHDAAGRIIDTVDQDFGVRQMAFDPAQGFLLNGRPYRLRGVGYHQDREDKGWAITPADVAQDVATLREMGVNAIRLTHYQHGQPIHELADRYGIILWDEIPLVSAWTLGDAKQPTPALRANARQQLAELIRQNENHASVANWGIANEVDFGNSLPAFLTGSTGTPPDPRPLLKELNSYAKVLDPSRPTALATCCEGRLFAPGVEVPVVAPEADLGGANRYFGWYYGKPEEVGPSLDALHASRPGQPLAVTEYGAGGATSIHTDNILGGPVDSRGRAQPEEYESYVHERNWAQLAARPYLWATWLWVAFDFASTVRSEGDAQDINTKGLVRFDHEVRKDAYYFYKANWSAAPTVHIGGRRYVARAYRFTDVRVYSNAPSTSLSLNGRVVGTLRNCPQHICVWSRLRLEPGSNRLSATGKFSSGPVEDRIEWHLPKEAERALRIDAGTLVAAKGKEGVWGSDNFFDGGEARSIVVAADYGKPAQPVVIAGTADSAIAATYREGDFHYRVPLDNGRYLVTLTFVRPGADQGRRVFDIDVNGKGAIRALALDQVPPQTALQRSVTARVDKGELDLHFRSIEGKSLVSAIEIVRQ
jgi:beta-galactosidase